MFNVNFYFIIVANLKPQQSHSAGVMRRFPWCTQENISLTYNGVESHCKCAWCFSASLNKVYPYGAQEWNINRINQTGGEK